VLRSGDTEAVLGHGSSPLRRSARSCVPLAGVIPANSTRWPASCSGEPGPPGPVPATLR
jgi:hypothetical protein